MSARLAARRIKWSILCLPPETNITSAPPAQTSNTSASFSFSSESGATFECGLDGADFAPCDSPKDYAGLADGSHTFRVRAVDAAGNKDSTPESRAWTVDTTAPSGTVSINGAAAYTRSTSVSLALSASDAGGVTWMRFSEDGVKWGEWEPYATTKAWTLVGANGTKTVFAQYRDGAGNVSETASDTIVLDTAKPSAGATTPANSATGRARKTNLTVAFSEKMDPATTNKSTFKLYKVTSTGTTQVTNVAVSLSPDGLKATLDPFGATSTLLAAKTKYKAVVTAGAKDLAGNALDQKPTAAGNQPKVWYFTTGAS